MRNVSELKGTTSWEQPGLARERQKEKQRQRPRGREKRSFLLETLPFIKHSKNGRSSAPIRGSIINTGKYAVLGKLFHP